MLSSAEITQICDESTSRACCPAGCSARLVRICDALRRKKEEEEKACCIYYIHVKFEILENPRSRSASGECGDVSKDYCRRVPAYCVNSPCDFIARSWFPSKACASSTDSRRNSPTTVASVTSSTFLLTRISCGITNLIAPTPHIFMCATTS